jgi:hypothetical protein
MKTRLTLRPGQNGTKKLVRKYGGRLVAVRYRYDDARRMRLKTVEIVEEELSWVQRQPRDRDPAEPVLIRIGYEEADLRLAVKSAGARWRQDRRLWEIPLGLVYELELSDRIVR